MHNNLSSLCISLEISIHEAIAQMEVERIGIVLVVDADRRLLGTMTDGDVRRAILADIDLDQPVSDLLTFKTESGSVHPITAPVDADRKSLLNILQQHGIQHLPLVDDVLT